MAKILLLADVAKLGSKGSIVDVKDGYAANFLIPKRLGKIASSQEVEAAAQVQKQGEQVSKKKFKLAQKLAATSQAVLIKNAVKVGVKTSAGGRVHGSIDANFILDEAMKNMPQLKDFEKSELEMKINQRVEYLGKYPCELIITLNEDGTKNTVKVPLYIDVVSTSEAKRKSTK